MGKFPFAEAILHQTDGGLQIIKDYYPDAKRVEGNLSKKFKMRADEKTASAALMQVQDGTWLVRDFGAWDKPKNAINVCMFEDGLQFGEACKKLAKLYNIEYNNVTHVAKPTITKRPKTAEETPGTYQFEYKEELTSSELKIIGPEVTNGVAKRFKLRSVHKLHYVTSKNEVVTSESTEDYPIFVYDFGTWQKIYQPKNIDKGFRFRYNGGRPKDYVFGLDDVRCAHQEHFDRVHRDAIDGKPPKDHELKLDKIIIASGDRDALNVASFGYYVVWLNSETATLAPELFKELKSMANEVLNLPDIDKTGVKQAVNLGLTYLDLKTIWLPNYLLQNKDWRGNSRKDFLDFVNLKYNSNRPQIVKKAFKKLIENALPMKFWDEQITDKGKKYVYNIVHAEHFLKHQGFYRMETPFEKDEYCYIFVDGNIVKRTSPNRIENFVNNFLEARQMPIPLRNMVKKTPYLKEAMLSKLPVLEIDFKDCDAETQFWFFKKNVVEIKKDKITIHKKGVVDKMVMEDKVIDFPDRTTERKFESAFQEPQFKIFKDAEGNFEIDVIKKDNQFFNFIINTSRMHWRKELEDSFKPSQKFEAETYFKENQFNIAGSKLDKDEIFEQKLHLINKIYAWGYILHKHKFSSRPWLVLTIDNKLSSMKESHGGTGKSIMFSNLEKIQKKQHFIPGRSKKVLESEFLFDGVTKETDHVFIDDLRQYFEYEELYAELTGKFRVNGKSQRPFTLSFQESPKLIANSNYPPDLSSPSTIRRVLLTVNSDYYHQNKNNEYKQTRKVSDDFNGKELFNDWDESQYLDFYAFSAQACSFYLSCAEKIGPPMDNVRKRNLIAQMGDGFMDWANVYFDKEGLNVDLATSRIDAYDDYKRKNGKKSANNFKSSIESFCEFKGYVFNPEDAGVRDGRIIKNINGKTQECFYIKTKSEKIMTDEELEQELY